MRVLITAGTGYIGSLTAMVLANAGYGWLMNPTSGFV